MRNFFIIVGLSVLSLLGAGKSSAQFPSPALDPNCYFPKIGLASEIDTIYGKENNQFFGTGIKNIGPFVGESYGHITIGNVHQQPINDPILFTMASTGPSFNLHKLTIVDTLTMGGDTWHHPRYFIKKVHFRSSKFKDVLYGDNSLLLPRIYWADSNGHYDSLRFTQLRTHFEDTDFFFHTYSLTPLYSTYLSSDSTEDIVGSVLKMDTLNQHHLLYLFHFKGSPNWKQSQFVYPDSVLFVDTIITHNVLPYRSFTQGDFRGTGRTDLIASDWEGNLFFYKNVPPFSLSSFRRSIINDTILLRSENPGLSQTLGGTPFESNKLTMRAFPKEAGDSSVDFVPDVYRKYDGDSFHDICLFKGGPTFGSHRIYIDSADFIIHEPRYYDARFSQLTFGFNLTNCGDMTGSGNPVLFVQGGGGGFYSAFYCYVLGKAMDDKADIFFDVDGVTDLSGVDTLVADGDRLQDFIMGMPGYTSQKDLSFGYHSVGTVFLVHGSTKIPVHSNKVHTLPINDRNIHIYPNPVRNGRLFIQTDFSVPTTTDIRILDILGRVVYQKAATIDNSKEQAIFVHSFQPGTYIVEISGNNFFKRQQIVIME